MRRIHFLFFLTLTAFQLAFFGVPVAAAAMQTGSHVAASEGTVRAEAPCVSGSTVQETACDSPQACTLCSTCQMCHQAALPDSHALAIPTRFVRLVFPPARTRYLSAERAPSFKPPIL